MLVADAIAVSAARRCSAHDRSLAAGSMSLTLARGARPRPSTSLIVYYVVYRALLLIRGTRAAQMLVGLVLVGAGFFAAKRLELTTLSWLLDNFINYSIIFFIVVFQHDIRRALVRVGAERVPIGRAATSDRRSFEEVIAAAERSWRARRIGALIVLERDAELDEYLDEPGVDVAPRSPKSSWSRCSCPTRDNKLHDGAVDHPRTCASPRRARCCRCRRNAELDKALGTRHRAALGVTEETDAVVVVVSEERGDDLAVLRRQRSRATSTRRRCAGRCSACSKKRSASGQRQSNRPPSLVAQACRRSSSRAQARTGPRSRGRPVTQGPGAL